MEGIISGGSFGELALPAGYGQGRATSLTEPLFDSGENLVCIFIDAPGCLLEMVQLRISKWRFDGMHAILQQYARQRYHAVFDAKAVCQKTVGAVCCSVCRKVRMDHLRAQHPGRGRTAPAQ